MRRCVKVGRWAERGGGCEGRGDWWGGYVDEFRWVIRFFECSWLKPRDIQLEVGGCLLIKREI
jgi:hypothetical protein